MPPKNQSTANYYLTQSFLSVFDPGQAAEDIYMLEFRIRFVSLLCGFNTSVSNHRTEDNF